VVTRWTQPACLVHVPVYLISPCNFGTASLYLALFSFCRLARRLNQPEELYVRLLEELPRGDLYAAAHAIRPSESRLNHRKAVYVRIL